MPSVTQPQGAAPEIERYRHGRVPRAVRERQLLELAGALFAERGFEGASMDELAERAGVSKPVIYKLFGSKRELFAACTNELGNQLTDVVIAAVEGSEDPEQLLRAGSLAFFQFVRDNAGLWSATYGPGGAPAAGDEEIAGELSEIRSRQNALVQTLIEAVTAPLELEPGRTAAFARGLNGMYEGLAGWALENPEVPTGQIARWMGEMILPGFAALVEREG